MSASLLEHLRAAHEEVERVERAASQLLLLQDQKCGTGPSSSVGVLKGEKRKREKLRLDWAAADLLSRMQESAQKCLQIYEDGDNLRKDEIAFLGGQREGGAGNDVWINFYERIRQIREFHRKRAMTAAAQGTDLNAAPEIKDPQALVEEANQTPYLDGVFDEAEQWGEMLNLHDSFTTFINWKPMRTYKVNEAKKAEAARLLKRGLAEEAVERMKDSRFEEDLIDYISYLKSFHLFSSIPRALKYRSSEYLAYLRGIVAYLQDFFRRRNPLADHDQVRKKFSEQFEEQWERKEVPGWQTLTAALPLYCRPTDKIFLSEGPRESHMQRTVAYHHKKQSRTAEELEEENRSSDDEDDQEAAKAVGDAERDSEDEDDDQPIYNPLNLPLGFDGRPIPFWLYKLHGLGQEFKCEICGNFSYWGRRAFERHFMEWRHAFGMRCLRIPNTTHFKEITKIEDAIKLYEKLKKDAEGKTFKDEQELECEDSQGNVMNLRAFEDLRRQGLL
ncbi:putative splicing factor 3a protein [Neospora caninum Liverpool]|uniref:Putative splicing factor 3a protein n=1 Tax=Neospora caninum (strain Liverpool) TaxID=572307 RepID=F0V8L9_NEOCL|nr:putative splicing factor 3a protein [Neospora caninum Liverpool]CBZ50060.1 putative splicing factor 3a protein [Neospora caninum Liverpool]|eukprot:XP_003880095.1 putative splicing factor 3a protein [Neospora caninum Liverpool]